MFTETVVTKFHPVTCCECSCTFAIDDTLNDRSRVWKKKSIYCPSCGTVQGWSGETIVCYTDKAYDIWMQGTQQLWYQKPVTRNAAIEHFNMLRGLPSETGVKWTEDDIPF